MEYVDIEEAAQTGRSADKRAGLTEALSLSDAAINYYELGPGDGFSGGLHTHTDQEEIFVILEGTATFETDTDTFEVSAGEAVRFAPGEYQTGQNEGNERVRGLAIGAPREQGETRSAVKCRECGAEYHVVRWDGDQLHLDCPECGHSFAP
ncbi:MAG: cupin domain-containing protein [Salinirussus sp.]